MTPEELAEIRYRTNGPPRCRHRADAAALLAEVGRLQARLHRIEQLAADAETAGKDQVLPVRAMAGLIRAELELA